MMALTELHADIDKRVEFIRSEHPDWLCRSGCEGCCHWLAEIPQLTAAEWDLLRKGLDELPLELLQSIGHDVAALAEQESRPLVCPLLRVGRDSCKKLRKWGYYSEFKGESMLSMFLFCGF